MITYPQAAWGDTPTATNAAGLLSSDFSTVYAATFGTLEVGIPGTAGFSIVFTDVIALLDYLPEINPIGPLVSDLLNPLSTASGAFGGVTALHLNVDFSDAGFTLGSSGIPFGDLILANFNTLPVLNALTVGQFLAIDNTALGGGSSIFSIADL